MSENAALSLEERAKEEEFKLYSKNVERLEKFFERKKSFFSHAPVSAEGDDATKELRELLDLDEGDKQFNEYSRECAIFESEIVSTVKEQKKEYKAKEELFLQGKLEESETVWKERLQLIHQDKRSILPRYFSSKQQVEQIKKFQVYLDAKKPSSGSNTTTTSSSSSSSLSLGIPVVEGIEVPPVKFICGIQYFDGEHMPNVKRIGYDSSDSKMTVDQLIRQFIKKVKTSTKNVTWDEKDVQKYVFKAPGQAEFFYGEHNLMEFEYIVKNLQQNLDHIIYLNFIETDAAVMNSDDLNKFKLHHIDLDMKKQQKPRYKFQDLEYNGDNWDRIPYFSNWEFDKPLSIKVNSLMNLEHKDLLEYEINRHSFTNTFRESGNNNSASGNWVNHLNRACYMTLDVMYGEDCLVKRKFSKDIPFDRDLFFNQTFLFHDLLVSEIPLEAVLLCKVFRTGKSSHHSTGNNSSSNLHSSSGVSKRSSMNLSSAPPLISELGGDRRSRRSTQSISIQGYKNSVFEYKDIKYKHNVSSTKQTNSSESMEGSVMISAGKEGEGEEESEEEVREINEQYEKYVKRHSAETFHAPHNPESRKSLIESWRWLEDDRNALAFRRKVEDDDELLAYIKIPLYNYRKLRQGKCHFKMWTEDLQDNIVYKPATENSLSKNSILCLQFEQYNLPIVYSEGDLPEKFKYQFEKDYLNRVKERVDDLAAGSTSPSASAPAIVVGGHSSSVPNLEQATKSEEAMENGTSERIAKQMIKRCLSSDPLHDFKSQDDKYLLFHVKEELQKHPKALARFLAALPYKFPYIQNDKFLVDNVLNAWAKFKGSNLSLYEYIELLDVRYPNEKVRLFAIEKLNELNDQELSEVLLQLVQALKYENHHDSPLARFLLQRCIRNPILLGNNFFWYLKSELHVSQIRERFGILLSVFLLSIGRHLRYKFVKQTFITNQFILLAMRMKRLDTKASQAPEQGGDKSKKSNSSKTITHTEALRKALYSELNQIIPFPKFSLPINPRMELRSVRIDKCKVMSSKKLPLWIVFTLADDDYIVEDVAAQQHNKFNLFKAIKTTLGHHKEESSAGAGAGASIDPTLNEQHRQPQANASIPGYIVMFKAGDDIRQDCLTLQILKLMDRLWRDEHLNLKIKPYACMSTGDMQGIIEIVTNSETIAKIMHSKAGAFGAFDKTPLKSFLQKQTKTYDWKIIEDNFIRSSAAYCCATYVIGIGDRHNDNIMLSRNGILFHIDFGHILGNFKSFMGVKRETSPFVFTQSYAAVMGGSASNAFKSYQMLSIQAFQTIRKYSNLLINLFLLMLSTNIPELRSKADVQWLKDCMILHYDDKAAEDFYLQLISMSLQNQRVILNDFVHIWKHQGFSVEKLFKKLFN